MNRMCSYNSHSDAGRPNIKEIDIDVQSYRAVAATLALVLAPIAISSIVLRIAIYFSLSFLTSSYTLVIVNFVIFFIVIFCYGRNFVDMLHRRIQIDRPALYLSLSACILAGLATTCIHRADIDDAIYLPKIIHYLTYPTSTMDGSVNELASHTPLFFPRNAAPYYPTAYEFAQAAFAFVCHVDFLNVYYELAPLLIGVLGIIALIFSIYLLGSSPRGAAYAGILLVPLILLLGETHRSYGNLSLARAFQSKFAFLFLGLPVFIALSLMFLRTRDARIWICLLTVVLAFCGMTTSALVMLPMLAVVFFAAWWLAEGTGSNWLRVGFTYMMCLLPAVIFALDFRRYAATRVGFGSALNSGFPRTFYGQFSLLEGGAAAPLSMVLFALALLVCAQRAKAHTLVLSWIALTFALYLNPLIAPWIMRYATSENIYWRLFYLLPFPLMLGVVCAGLFDRFPFAWNRRKWAAGAFVLCGSALLISPTSTLRTDNGARVAAPGWTLDANMPEARNILAIAPDGVMLAPIPLAQDIVILSARHPQVATRADFMANVLAGQPEEYDLRFSAASFVAGTGGSLNDLSHILQRDLPVSVVLARSTLSSSINDQLNAAGLHGAGEVGSWVVYVRKRADP